MMLEKSLEKQAIFHLKGLRIEASQRHQAAALEQKPSGAYRLPALQLCFLFYWLLLFLCDRRSLWHDGLTTERNCFPAAGLPYRISRSIETERQSLLSRFCWFLGAPSGSVSTIWIPRHRMETRAVSYGVTSDADPSDGSGKTNSRYWPARMKIRRYTAEMVGTWLLPYSASLLILFRPSSVVKARQYINPSLLFILHRFAGSDHYE